MSRLDQERQDRLEPQRIESCKAELEKMGFYVSQDHTSLKFEFRGSIITFWPYSGWFSGKTVTDGRGFKNLVHELELMQ